MRAVVDPNVLVSAWISRHGHSRRILEAAEDGSFEMVVSGKVLTELLDVLSRERLRRYGPLDAAEEHVHRSRTAAGVFIEVEGELERIVPDDPKDDYLIALARVSEADYIVSGDPHLHNLHEVEDLPTAVNPRDFWELLESLREENDRT